MLREQHASPPLTVSFICLDALCRFCEREKLRGCMILVDIEFFLRGTLEEFFRQGGKLSERTSRLYIPWTYFKTRHENAVTLHR